MFVHVRRCALSRKASAFWNRPSWISSMRAGDALADACRSASWTLSRSVSRRQTVHHAVFSHVARADLDARGHALQLPLVELPARRHRCRGRQASRAVRRPSACRRRPSRPPARLPCARRPAPQPPDTARSSGGSFRPRSSPWVMMIAPMRRVLKCPSSSHARTSACRPCPGYWMSNGSEKFVPKLWLVPALQRLAVLHHRLHGIRRARAGELFLVALAGRSSTGMARLVFAEVAVNVQHLHRLFLRLLGSGVDGVALLPEELGRCAGTGACVFSQRMTEHHWLYFMRQIAPAAAPTWRTSCRKSSRSSGGSPGARSAARCRPA